MRLLPLWTASLLLAAAADRRPTAEPPIPPAGVTVTHTGDARVLRAVVPGRIAAIELPRRADRHLDLVLLLAGDDQPVRGADPSVDEPGQDGARPDRVESASLVRVDPGGGAGEESLRPLLRDLPPGALGALDVDGDGAEELLLATDEELYTLGSATAPHAPSRLLDTAETELLMPSRWSDRGLGGIAVSGVGRTRLLVPDGGVLTAALDLVLPTSAVLESRGILLSSPPVAAVAGAPSRLVAGPEAVGRQRLRSLLLDAGSTSDAWSLLPAPEAVDTATYAMLDGRPVLIVVTTNAGRLGIFEKKKLRVFALEADRTLAGHAPTFAAATTSHRWLPVTTTIGDVDRDGHDDLIVLQSEGMGGGETVIETFFGGGEGRLATRGRRQKLGVRSEAWIYGHDLTGDGIGDLVVLEEDAGASLLVFAGTGEPRRALLEREARVTIALGAAGSSIRELRCADLDADGTSEAILLGNAGKSRDLVVVAAVLPQCCQR